MRIRPRRQSPVTAFQDLDDQPRHHGGQMYRRNALEQQLDPRVEALLRIAAQEELRVADPVRPDLKSPTRVELDLRVDRFRIHKPTLANRVQASFRNTGPPE